jgi:hypothetical protein
MRDERGGEDEGDQDEYILKGLGLYSGPAAEIERAPA